MKAFILTFLMIVTFICQSQVNITNDIDTTKLPQFVYSDSVIVGVIFSLKQAQKIDSDYELYTLMDTIINQYGVSDSITISIINTQSGKISSLESKVVVLSDIIKDKDKALINRNSVIDELKYKAKIQDEQLENYSLIEESHEKEKKDLNKEISKQKRQKVIAFISTTAGAIGIVLLNILVK